MTALMLAVADLLSMPAPQHGESSRRVHRPVDHDDDSVSKRSAADPSPDPTSFRKSV